MKISMRSGAKMQTSVIAAIAVIAVIALAGFVAWHQASSTTTYSGTPASITIGTPFIEAAGLIFIAEDQGFFKKSGLNVTIKYYDSGLATVNGLLNGEVDIGSSSELGLVTMALQKKKISTFANINKGDYAYVVGRRDRGINNITDLKGKRIGVSMGTISQFYLGRSLSLQGISMQDVTLINIAKSQFADAIINGSVDAVVATHPYIDTITDRLGSNVVVLPVQNNKYTYELLICKDDWITKNPGPIGRFLESLAMADDYVGTHPAEAKAIIQKRMHYDDAYMKSSWNNSQYSLSLDQSILIAMSDEGRWMINNNLTSEKTLPYFQDYIYTKGLEEVKPESVNIR